MSHTVLIIPDHGRQTSHSIDTLSAIIPHSKIVPHIDFEQPVLVDWAQAICYEIQQLLGHIWIIAEGFACLAASVAIADGNEHVAGLIFIDPANPNDFTILGKRQDIDNSRCKSIESLLPTTPLAAFGVLVHRCGSALALNDVQGLAEQWGLSLYQAVQADQPQWRFIQRLLLAMQASSIPLPHGDLIREKPERQGKGSVLANVRKHTREGLYYV